MKLVMTIPLLFLNANVTLLMSEALIAYGRSSVNADMGNTQIALDPCFQRMYS